MIVLFASLAFAGREEVAALPVEVVVFADRARVVRRAEVALPAGRSEVVFTGLPASMMAEGVTADAEGPGVLRGIDVRSITASEAADARVKEIGSQIEKLADQRQQVADEVAAWQTELASLQAARLQSAAALDAQMLYASGAPRQAAALRSATSAEDTAVRANWRAADQKLRAFDEQIASLDRERSTLGTSATDTWTATVHLDLDRAGRVEVDLSYLVSGASWTPRYDLRGDAETAKVELALSAMVQQTSGEDWRDVKLTVSSARPQLGTTVPTLDPFWLQRPYYYPPMAAESVASMAGGGRDAPMKSASAPAAAPPPEQPMQVAQATVQIELAATAFTVARPEDVPADGTARKVLLTTQSLDAKLRHVIVPRLDPRAYLVGEVENTAEFPLLAGTAGVFLAGSYLGDMQLETVPPGQKFDVAFGVDDHLTIKRTPKQIQEDRSGPVGKRQASKWTWHLTIKNGHRRSIQAHVLEQIPVPTRDDVKVAVLPSTPAPVEKDEGMLEFVLTVGAGAEAVVDWGYQVEYPSDISLGWME